MANVFSPPTLQAFEDASASIVLRQIDRAFGDAGIGLGEFSGDVPGDRRLQFRRYVTGVDQHDPQQLERLGAALGALVAAAATSKERFLINAAERDGFFFVDGVFRSAQNRGAVYAIDDLHDFASIDEYGRRLYLIADERAADAIDGAAELLASVCWKALHTGDNAASEHRTGSAKSVDVVELAGATMAALEAALNDAGDVTTAVVTDRRYLPLLADAVARMRELRDAGTSTRGRDGSPEPIEPRYARLAIGAAITFARFVAETYVVRVIEKTGKPTKFKKK